MSPSMVFLQVLAVFKDDVHVSFVYVYVSFLGYFSRTLPSPPKKTKQTNKWSNYYLLEVNFFHILLEREDWISLKRCKNAGYVTHWIVQDFLPSEYSLVHNKWNIFLTNLFQKLYPPLQILKIISTVTAFIVRNLGIKQLTEKQWKILKNTGWCSLKNVSIVLELNI